MNNTATAHDLLRALDWIAERERQGSAPARQMAEVLRQQEHRTGIPAGLPEKVAVGNKTGWITAIRHDAAIVYPPAGAPYVLVVLTRGFGSHEEADRLIAAISRAVWAARTAASDG
jgi:beta-lactamase class A